MNRVLCVILLLFCVSQSLGQQAYKNLLISLDKELAQKNSYDSGKINRINTLI